MAKKKAVIKHTVHNLIVLDESGSMDIIKSAIISGFNELVQTIKGIQKKFPDQEHFVSFISFNTLTGNKVLNFMDPVSKLEEINTDKYRPGGSTPLRDAIGFGVKKLQMEIKDTEKCDTLVTILTDGLENASTEYSAEGIKKLIEEMTAKGWTFTYMGANQNAEEIAKSMSVSNFMNFAPSSGGVKRVFRKHKLSMESYSATISKGPGGQSVNSFYAGHSTKAEEEEPEETKKEEPKK